MWFELSAPELQLTHLGLPIIIKAMPAWNSYSVQHHMQVYMYVYYCLGYTKHDGTCMLVGVRRWTVGVTIIGMVSVQNLFEKYSSEPASQK